MPSKPKRFIEMYAQAAIDACKGTGIFPSVLLAKGIIESDSGTSNKAIKGYNFFSAKANANWAGDYFTTGTGKTVEYVNGKRVLMPAKWRKYDSPKDAFADVVKILTSSRYDKAGVSNARTPEEQIKAIIKAGYASDPNYFKLLANPIRQLNLKEVDKKLKNNETAFLAPTGIFEALTNLFA